MKTIEAMQLFGSILYPIKFLVSKGFLSFWKFKLLGVIIQLLNHVLFVCVFPFSCWERDMKRKHDSEHGRSTIRKYCMYHSATVGITEQKGM